MSNDTRNDTREALAAVKRHASEMGRYFTSGNCVPIERAVIPATEWHALHAVIDELAALTEQPAAPQQAEHFDEIEATLRGAHAVMESVSAMERRVGPVGSHARGYTHKITNALKHLAALRAAAPQGVQAEPPFTDDQRLYLHQAVGFLDEYAEECSRGGADSTAAGCKASAYVLQQILCAAPAAPAQEPQQLAALKDHEIRELVNDLTKIAREYHATQQLRERIADLVVPMLKRAASSPAPAQEPQQPAPTSIPNGWRFVRNADGSIGIWAPAPRPGESPRTSDCVYPERNRDLHELLGKLADHQAAQEPQHAAAPSPAPAVQPLTPATAGVPSKMLDLANRWADNKIHTYQFAAEAERIVADAIRTSGSEAVAELVEALRVLVDRNFTFFSGGMIGADRKITRDEVLAARALIAKHGQLGGSNG